MKRRRDSAAMKRTAIDWVAVNEIMMIYYTDCTVMNHYYFML